MSAYQRKLSEAQTAASIQSKELVRRLRLRCAELDWTSSDLCKAYGVSLAQCRRIENYEESLHRRRCAVGHGRRTQSRDGVNQKTGEISMTIEDKAKAYDLIAN